MHLAVGFSGSPSLQLVDMNVMGVSKCEPRSMYREADRQVDEQDGGEVVLISTNRSTEAFTRFSLSHITDIGTPTLTSLMYIHTRIFRCTHGLTPRGVCNVSPHISLL